MLAECGIRKTPRQRGVFVIILCIWVFVYLYVFVGARDEHAFYQSKIPGCQAGGGRYA